MNFFTLDNAQPPDKVRIERLLIQPYPEGWRVKVIIEVTPFLQRPNLEIQIRSSEGRPVAALSVIETMHPHMEFTVHIRGVASPVGDYVAEVDLYYESREKPQERRTEAFRIDQEVDQEMK